MADNKSGKSGRKIKGENQTEKSKKTKGGIQGENLRGKSKRTIKCAFLG